MYQRPKKRTVADIVRIMISIDLHCMIIFPAERKSEQKKKLRENVASCERCSVSFAKLLKRKVNSNMSLVFVLSVFVLSYLNSTSAIIVVECSVARAQSELKNLS